MIGENKNTNLNSAFQVLLLEVNLKTSYSLQKLVLEEGEYW